MTPKRSKAFDRATRRCYLCERTLSLDNFLTIKTRQKRAGRVYEYLTPSHDCFDCRKEARREQRRKNAEAAGRQFVPRGDRAAHEAQLKALREKRKAEGLARLQRMLDEFEAVRSTIRNSVRLECVGCRRVLDRDQFYESFLELAKRSHVRCRQCSSQVDAARFSTARESLSDSYVKRQLTKYTGLRASDIPPSLIEAKRAQLMIQRIVSPRTGKTPTP